MKEPLMRCGAALLLLAALSTALTAQATVKYENPDLGYRISVHKSLKAIPTEPNERQILAKWQELGEKTGVLDRNPNTLLLVRIKKATGPTTGPDQPEGDKPDEPEKSLRDEATEQLNSATTVEEFLKKRSYKNELKPVTGEKAVKSKQKLDYVVQHLPSDETGKNAVPSLIRSYMLEDAGEFFGLVALGRWDKEWADIVLDAAKSLERITLGTNTAAGESSADLEHQGFRDQVRKKLVKGWQAYDTEHYIFVTNSTNKKLIDQILVDLELMRSAYLERFPPAPGVDMDSVISAVRFCTTYKDYQAYGGPAGTGGYWNYMDEELVLVDVMSLGKEIIKANPNLENIQVLDVLYHEAMHQYFYYANGQLAPASWFNEGFGEVFGGAVPDRSKGAIAKIDRNRFRMAWIKRQQAAKRWPDLRVLLKMAQYEFYGASSLQNYAFGWAFCFFLEQQRKDPKGNKDWGEIPDRYLANLRAATQKKREELKIGEDDKKWLSFWETEIQKDAFEATFKGMDLVALENAWIDAMKKWK
ncbi:MAG: hypothetical protein IPK26_05250 [Planctomycetes bacterium]|nr:hypothetical protein [Planctomycetota bacterium]